MSNHDRFCPEYMQYADPCPICIVIASARADERAQYQGRRDDMMRALSEELLNVRTKTLADLRAKAEAAREQFMRVTRTPWDHPMAMQWDEFITMIDGSTNG